ncbi:MAG: DNA polymerase I [Candidatus Magasanikbacteria bacterium]|nr:DNA polymerase I [Candidatus Magasanikbacteria bacterium]
MKNTENVIVIIDGNAIIHRAYHALPPMTTKDGTIVNAVYGFASMLIKVITDLAPSHIAVTFDVPGGTFREEVYSEYKAHREKADQELYDQIPIIYELVESFGLPIYTKEGFEADDVIGTLAEQTEKEGQVIIVTGDKDMLQLVNNEHVGVFLLQRGMSDYQLYDRAAVQNRFGFGPEMVTDYKALMGDPSDNIPGVKGVGKKTAAQLIEQFGPIEALYDAVKEKTAAFEALKPGVKSKLIEGKDNAFMSKELATIVRDVEGITLSLDDASIAQITYAGAKSFLQRCEFFSLVKRLPGEKKVAKKKEKKEVELVHVTKKEQDDFFALLKKQTELIILPFFAEGKKLTKLAFEIDGKVHVYDAGELGCDQILKLVVDMDVPVICGHSKALAKAILGAGLAPKVQWFDIEVASYVVHGSARSHDMVAVLTRELGVEFKESTSQSSLFGETDESEQFEGTQYLRALWKMQQEQLKDIEGENVFYDIEMPLISILARMEWVGISIAENELNDLKKTLDIRVAELTKEIHGHAKKEFNIASSVQLREILFEELELPTAGIKKGKTGYSTAASELEKLRDEHDIIHCIEEFRELTKLLNTYIDVLPTLVDSETGRIHTSFNQTVTATGRLSSSDPNLQNIPIRSSYGKKIRDAFVAAEGYTFVIADYSQIELRIAAALSKDARMLEIFEAGEDVHKATAAAIEGVPLKDVTKEMRSAAKAVNFGVLFGMGAFGLAWRTNLTQKQAKHFIEEYYKAFSGLKTYLDETIEQAHKDGYVETLYGRRRYVPELTSGNYQMRAAGERMAINMPIQGTEADMMKLAMIEVQKRLEEAGYAHEEARQLLQVHDELVLEVKKGKEADVMTLVEEAMLAVSKLNVPVVVDAAVSASWGGVK